MDWILTGSAKQSLLLISGAIAVGKSSVVTILCGVHNYRKISSGQFLASEAAKKGLASTRAVLVELGDQLDRDTDYLWVVRDVAARALRDAPEHVRWIFDSARKTKQIAHFRAAFPEQVYHVHLTASDQTLRARYRCRQRDVDETIAYVDAIDTDNERQARSLISIADLVQTTDDLDPHAVAMIIHEEFEQWSKSFC